MAQNNGVPSDQYVQQQHQQLMSDQLAQMDPETVMKNWLAPGLEGFSQFLKAMWTAAMGDQKNKD